MAGSLGGFGMSVTMGTAALGDTFFARVFVVPFLAAFLGNLGGRWLRGFLLPFLIGDFTAFFDTLFTLIRLFRR